MSRTKLNNIIIMSIKSAFITFQSLFGQAEEDSSPVRTILGSLAGDKSPHPSRKSSMATTRELVSHTRRKEDRRPVRIEEVPFR